MITTKDLNYCCDYGLSLWFVQGQTEYLKHSSECWEAYIVKEYNQHTEMYDEYGEEIIDYEANELQPALYRVWVFVNGYYDIEYTANNLELSEAFDHIMEIRRRISEE